jgi:hypothetical protein
MPKRLSTVSVAFTSLVFTYLFFGEYLSPLRKVYVTFDLWGYHYPLMDYAFQSLKRFSFPTWDPSIYCGQPFAGNIQAALFYPPAWILYALSAGHGHLPYRALEAFIFAHIWLGFLLSFCWLRNKRLSDLASILGAGIFAFSGYAMLQLQHQGLLCGYAWLPLGLWGIDELTQDRGSQSALPVINNLPSRDHRERWFTELFSAACRAWPGFLKIVASSAACFLAGYPPTWLVLAIYLGVYALFSGRLTVVAQTFFALAASLAVSAIQLLPSLEASLLMLKENRYAQIRDLWFYLSYLVPNFYDFGIDVPATTNLGREYLYLGAPALFGICALLVHRRWRPAIPVLASAGVCLVFLTNPFQIVSNLIAKGQILSQVCGSWYFLAGLTASAAGLAAFGLDQFLASGKEQRSKTWAIAAIVCSTAWAIYEIHAWRPDAPAFRAGWWSALDALASLIVFAICILALRKQSGRLRVTMTVVLLLSAAIDYKSFGTSKRFNGRLGALPHEYARDGFWGIGPLAFQELVAHPQYRILLDFAAPMPAELRHHGLSSPQGSDPFVAERYLDLVKDLGTTSHSNREFSFDSDNQLALETLAVRYVITTGNGPLYSHLEANPAFKLIGRDAYYFHVYEYEKYAEPFLGPAKLLSRTPETRRFQTRSLETAQFVLKEQFFPGWTANLDGRAIPIQLWRGAFQSAEIPPGEHLLEFQYHPRSLKIGAWISAISILLLIAMWSRHA